MIIYDVLTGNTFERDLTKDEIAERETQAAYKPSPSPTPEERLAALEEELAATKILLGVDV